MAKKKGSSKKTPVKGSKAHRRKGGPVQGYYKGPSKPHRNKPYKRNRRSTKEQIKKRGGTRKEVRAKKKRAEREKRKEKQKAKVKQQKKTVKTKQTRLAKPRKRPAQRSLKKAK